jgi:hypothetical protein
MLAPRARRVRARALVIQDVPYGRTMSENSIWRRVVTIAIAFAAMVQRPVYK